MHRNKLIVTSLIFGLLMCLGAQAEVYKTVDKNGKVTYTDVPPENGGAKPVELKSINSIPAPAVVPVEPPAPQAFADYSVEILAPENGKTLMPGDRSVDVSVGINQGIQSGHKLAYKVDGNVVYTGIETKYTIVEPPRGEHSLTVDIVNSEGKSLAQSKAITVLVMRPLAKQHVAPVPRK